MGVYTTQTYKESTYQVSCMVRRHITYMLHDAQVDKADDVFGVSLKATKCAKPELSVRELTKR
jgi:hypothetical protein